MVVLLSLEWMTGREEEPEWADRRGTTRHRGGSRRQLLVRAALDTAQGVVNIIGIMITMTMIMITTMSIAIPMFMIISTTTINLIKDLAGQGKNQVNSFPNYIVLYWLRALSGCLFKAPYILLNIHTYYKDPSPRMSFPGSTSRHGKSVDCSTNSFLTQKN